MAGKTARTRYHVIGNILIIDKKGSIRRCFPFFILHSRLPNLYQSGRSCEPSTFFITKGEIYYFLSQNNTISPFFHYIAIILYLLLTNKKDSHEKDKFDLPIDLIGHGI